MTTWTSQAACRSKDPRLFFPDPGLPSWVDAAKQVCADCPVQAACLEFAIAEGAVGVWAGTSDAERRSLGSLASARRVARVQRRREVEALTARGLSAHDIGERLAISPRDVVRLRRESREARVAS